MTRDLAPYADVAERWPEDPKTGLPVLPDEHYWRIKYSYGYVEILLMRRKEPTRTRFLRKLVNQDVTVGESPLRVTDYTPDRFYVRALQVLARHEEDLKERAGLWELPAEGNYPPNRMPS